MKKDVDQFIDDLRDATLVVVKGAHTILRDDFTPRRRAIIEVDSEAAQNTRVVMDEGKLHRRIGEQLSAGLKPTEGEQPLGIPMAYIAAGLHEAIRLIEVEHAQGDPRGNGPYHNNLGLRRAIEVLNTRLAE